MRGKWLTNLLKGLWVGSTMTVPGVSGGTMAVVVGIYEDLIHAINGLKKNRQSDEKSCLQDSFFFLVQFVAGAGIGFLVFAKVITALLENTLTGSLTRLFFCGIVVGGIPLLIEKSGVHKLTWKHILFMLGGAILVLAMTMLPVGMFSAGSGLTFWILQCVAGIIIAIALILPGISVTHILYIMGLYEVVLRKVYELQFLSLVPLAFGVVVGTFLTADLLEKGMKKYPEEVCMAIAGFVAASLSNLIPKENVDMPFVGIGVAVIGFVCMYLLSKRAGGK